MTLDDAHFSAMVTEERREETESILSENMATNIPEPYRIELGRGNTINLRVPSFLGGPPSFRGGTVLHNLSVETARRLYLELRDALFQIDRKTKKP